MIVLLCFVTAMALASLAVAATMRSLLRDALRLIDTLNRRVVVLEARRELAIMAEADR